MIPQFSTYLFCSLQEQNITCPHTTPLPKRQKQLIKENSDLDTTYDFRRKLVSEKNFKKHNQHIHYKEELLLTLGRVKPWSRKLLPLIRSSSLLPSSSLVSFALFLLTRSLVLKTWFNWKERIWYVPLESAITNWTQTIILGNL